MPELVVDGPVRKIIKTVLNEHTRYFAGYNWVDILEVIDVFKYPEKWDPKFTALTYTNHYTVGIFDRNNELMVPLAGETTVIKMSDVKVDPGAAKIFYTTSNPEAGWFGWFNNEKKIGLATFFPEKATVYIMVTTFDKCLGKAYGNPNNNVTIKVPELAMQKNFWSTGITYAGFSTPDQAAVFYEFNAKPRLKFGFLEEQKK
jgi:hypothetical protein